jgi:hypothetical protein
MIFSTPTGKLFRRSAAPEQEDIFGSGDAVAADVKTGDTSP